MRGSTKRFMSIIMALVILVAAVFVYSVLIRPAYSDINGLRAKVNDKTITFNQQQASVKQIQNLLSQYQDVLKVEDTISSILPLSADSASSLNQITGLAKINNLNLDLLSVQEAAITPSGQSNLIHGIGTLKLNFHLTGSYENFKAFLQNMETNITLFDLSSLKLEEVSRGRVGSDNFSYTLTVNTYYQSQ